MEPAAGVDVGSAGVLIIVGLFQILLSLGQLVAAVFVYIHAFQKSVKDGFLTLCVPCYIFYYIEKHFQHERRKLIVGVFYGCLAANILINAVSRAVMR